MASHGRYAAAIWGFLLAFLFASLLVRCDDEEDHLLQGINSYRQSLNVPALAKHDKANCLAEEIADEIEDQPCPRPGSRSSPPQIGNLQKHLDKCKIDANSTKDGAILPVCVRKRVPTLVLTNYTQSFQNAKFLNDSRFTGAGIGTDDDWTVLVLTTNTEAGMFAAASAAVVNASQRLMHLLQVAAGMSLFMLL
ncbi:unnamed protein product [Cuscuta epithymum]|uniref:Uncharacterized GPI-anchored protein At5g19230-like domain-containing protein n=1 Tax=Cuscuta epithymum TaxID=186058 RepID=A0AAV0CFT5_9ASTE|nr:unnamed protein product [Cuscuta epithymum]CAH9145165.1 unnamed protein product [Cuscuta epithymum]